MSKLFFVRVESKTFEGLKDELRKVSSEIGIGTYKTNEGDNASVTTVEIPATPAVDPSEAYIKPALEAIAPLVETLAPVSAPTGELDSENLPWDKRIHTTAKTKTKMGMWKLKRGSDPAVVAQVKAELLQAQAPAAPIPAAPITSATPVVAPVLAPAPDPSMPTVSAPVVTAPETVAAPTLAPAAPAPVAPMAPASGHTLQTFTQQFPMILGTLITEGKVSEEYINQLKEYFKVAQIWDITDAQKVA